MMNQIEQELALVKRNELPKRSDEEIEILAKTLLAKMTLKEKIGQLVQSGTDCSEITGPSFDASKVVENITNGMVGSILGTHDDRFSFNLQQKAMESRLGIPLMFCADIIHGCRTSFPVNLAMSGSFDLDLVEEACKVAAYEAAHSGVDLVFSPMVDLVRDPRWGRVMESNGEDPFLSSKFAKAYVRGYQQDELASYDSVASCLKHYCCYGAAEGGREYNTVDVSVTRLHNLYLPPFKAGIEEDVCMVMSSFNVFNDIPVTVNKYLLRDVLRDELGFKGVVISDYTSSGEVMHHKCALDEREVAKRSILAGLDHEMISPTYALYLEELVLNNEVSQSLVDEACLRVLKLKYKLGLFDNPYKHLYLNSKDYFKTPHAIETSLKMAYESIVLLQNKNEVLPLNKNEKIALIGPFGDTRGLVGPWGGKCDRNDCETLLEVFKKEGYNVNYVQGCDILGNYYNLEEVLEASKNCDTIVFACGENEYMSGEAASRAMLTLPGRQEEMLRELSRLGKKLILCIHAGRPLVLREYRNLCDSILYCWFLGTMSSKAICDTLFGINNPSAKLTMSFPYCEGQIPVYYNHLQTGRPQFVVPDEKYCSHYMDIPNDPLYKFGHGLSYSKFEYSNLTYKEYEDHFIFNLDVLNNSNRLGTDIVMLFVNVLNATISLPMAELKGFSRVEIKANEKVNVEIKLEKKDLTYFVENKLVDVKGEVEVFVGGSLDNNLKTTIKL